jgi:hypothetical protein
VFTGPLGLRDATDVCAGDELPAEAIAVGLSLLAERCAPRPSCPASSPMGRAWSSCPGCTIPSCPPVAE